MEYYRITIELIKAVAWPLLVLYILIRYRVPLRRLILMIPQKLEHATKVSIGSLALEMQATLTNIGDVDLALEVPKLSREAYETILTLTENENILTLITFSGGQGGERLKLASPEEMEVALELERVGLIQGPEPIENFLTFAKSLPHKKSLLGGATTWILRDSVKEEEFLRLMRFYCRITPKGRKLYEVMIDVILSSLTAKSEPIVRNS